MTNDPSEPPNGIACACLFSLPAKPYASKHVLTRRRPRIRCRAQCLQHGCFSTKGMRPLRACALSEQPLQTWSRCSVIPADLLCVATLTSCDSQCAPVDKAGAEWFSFCARSVDTLGFGGVPRSLDLPSLFCESGHSLEISHASPQTRADGWEMSHNRGTSLSESL